MLKFTLCFIKQGDRILLLNREKPSWMGCWNALGGKLEPDESPRASAIREIKEEAGINLDDVQFRGIVTWIVEGAWAGGMYVYFAELPASLDVPVPMKSDEGILDWKTVDWILHPKNQGIANNIPKSIGKIISGTEVFEHRCFYENDRLFRDEFRGIDKEVEHVKEIDDLLEIIGFRQSRVHRT
jgi:8-oxo-dGTP diphosphatase